MTSDKAKILEDVRFSYNHNFEVLESAKSELEQITKVVKAKGYGHIVCTNTMHPGTRVLIGDAKRNISEPIKNAFLYVKEGEIVIGSGT